MRQIPLILMLSITMVFSVKLYSQEDLPAIIAPRSTLGIGVGTGLFQGVSLNLFDFNKNLISSSDELTPTHIKVHYSFFITPHFAIQFASGYEFSVQKERNRLNPENVIITEVETKSLSVFSMEGFPIEITLIGQQAINKDENIHVNFGIGMGYYSYNYQAQGKYRENSLKTGRVWEEEYINPVISLGGFAQYFVFGINLKLSENIGTFFNISKAGLTYLQIKQDFIKQNIYNHEVENETKYGYYKKDYQVQSGFNDVSMTIGLVVKL